MYGCTKCYLSILYSKTNDKSILQTFTFTMIQNALTRCMIFTNSLNMKNLFMPKNLTFYNVFKNSKFLYIFFFHYQFEHFSNLKCCVTPISSWRAYANDSQVARCLRYAIHAALYSIFHVYIFSLQINIWKFYASDK